jgi:hypothetical protein
MLWVRIPPELLSHTSSQSSLECSPPCHGGDRRFKSDRGRLNGAVCNLAKQRSSNLRGMWVRLPPAPFTLHASAGHWRAQVAVTHPPFGTGGSTPSRRTSSRTARSSSGSGCWPLKPATRVQIPHGSLRFVKRFHAGWVGARPALIRPAARFDTGACNFVRRPSTQTKVKRPGREPGDFVGSTPTSVNPIPWSNGTTPARHAGSDGSTPSGITRDIVGR